MDSKPHRSYSYEESWQQAFEDARMTPPEQLWDNIDAKLTKQESGKYRRGFIFYRAVAAAFFLCLLGLGIYMLNNNLQSPAEQISTAEQPVSPSANGNPDTGRKENAEQPTAPSQEPAASTLADNSGLSEEQDTKTSAEGTQGPAGPGPAASGAVRSQLPSAVAASLPEGTAQAQIQKVAAQGMTPATAGSLAWIQEIEQLYRVPNPYAAKGRKKEQQQPVFFAGLDFSGSYFDPNFSASSGSAAMDGFGPAGTEEGLYRGNQESELSTAADGFAPGVQNTPRVSFSYGADLGVHLSRHISLESGIDYGRFNTSTQTNLAMESQNSGKVYPYTFASSGNTANANFSYTTETELTNAFELLTLPLKLAYNLQFERVNLFVSSGMAANFFINNRISDASGRFATVNVQADAGSPYNRVFYSGVLSGGLQYNFTGNYFLTLAPEYSFSLSQMTKEGLWFSSQPYLFGMDIGIRYQFR